MASIDFFNCDPDRITPLLYHGGRVVIRRWYDTGNMAVWSNSGVAWDRFMTGLAARYDGRFVEQYSDWYFPGRSANEVEAEILRFCGRS